MKKLVAIALVVVCCMGAALITQNESLVSAGLKELKFESVPAPKVDGKSVMGAPPQFKVTKETIEFLTKLQKDGKVIQVDGDGKVEIVKPK
jgi:hypothetical protein